MIGYCRTAAVAVAIAGFAVCGGAVTAHAQTSDERFEEAVTAMGITAAPGTDVAAMGRSVCVTLTEQMAVNPNPVPVVRGVVGSLQNANMSRKQAVSFVQVSAAIYCPQHARLTGL